MLLDLCWLAANIKKESTKDCHILHITNTALLADCIAGNEDVCYCSFQAQAPCWADRAQTYLEKVNRLVEPSLCVLPLIPEVVHNRCHSNHKP